MRPPVGEWISGIDGQQRTRDVPATFARAMERWGSDGRTGAAIEALHTRLDAIGCESVDLSTSGPFAIGLGAMHPTENGFAFDRNLGVPYIPGSALKGMCREMAEVDGLSPQLIETLFGPGDEAEVSHQGAVTFLPAYPRAPSAGGLIQADVLNPHSREYYDEVNENGRSRNGPSPVESPVPVYFLTVPEGRAFVFRWYAADERTAREAGAILERGLAILGVGAKTSSGYGVFRRVGADIPDKPEEGRYDARFDAVILMHPHAERTWVDSMPGASEAGIQPRVVSTKDGPWHITEPLDSPEWTRVAEGIRGAVEDVRKSSARSVFVFASGPYELLALLASRLQTLRRRVLIHQFDTQKQSWVAYGPDRQGEERRHSGDLPRPLIRDPATLPEAEAKTPVVVLISATAQVDVREVERVFEESKERPRVEIHLHLPEPSRTAVREEEVDAIVLDLRRHVAELAAAYPESDRHLFYAVPSAVLMRLVMETDRFAGRTTLYLRRSDGEKYSFVPALELPSEEFRLGPRPA
jgi:CRISPR/Cas system CMR subunit Cmr6 (Cas7 group RAMP superfamily)